MKLLLARTHKGYVDLSGRCGHWHHFVTLTKTARGDGRSLSFMSIPTDSQPSNYFVLHHFKGRRRPLGRMRGGCSLGCVLGTHLPPSRRAALPLTSSPALCTRRAPGAGNNLLPPRARCRLSPSPRCRFLLASVVVNVEQRDPAPPPAPGLPPGALISARRHRSEAFLRSSRAAFQCLALFSIRAPSP